jgi:NCAIR mutase (PurE)-related protein
MNESELKRMLHDLIAGEIDVNQTVHQLKNTLLRNTVLEYAQPDHHRELRHGLNEVIYGEGKTSGQIIEIAAQLSMQERCVLITRLDEKKLSDLVYAFPGGRVNERARTFMVHSPAIIPVDFEKQFVAIVSAGTSDIPVAEEAYEVCIAKSQCSDCGCWNGRSPAQCGRWLGRLTGYCGSNECGVWSQS